MGMIRKGFVIQFTELLEQNMMSQVTLFQDLINMVFTKQLEQNLMRRDLTEAGMMKRDSQEIFTT